MLIGQTIFAANGVGLVYYGPWMPRQGDTLVAVVEVIKNSASGWTLDCAVQTKNMEDADSSVGAALATVSLSAVGTQNAIATGCLELVRYKFTATGSGADRWLHIRANPPIWQPN